MTRRQPRKLPHDWMMSDERMGDAFLPSLARMPKGSGLVFRHYSLAAAERRALFEAARKITRARRMVLILVGPAIGARGWRADGAHGRSAQCKYGLRTAPVHNVRELVAAKRAAADLIFISPVFPTRSHLGGRTLGRSGFVTLARQAKVPAIALGGMTSKRAQTLSHSYGWAGIDAWL